MSEDGVELFGSRRLWVRKVGEVRAADRVAIVGAGIVGSSIAYHLASRGAEVTVFEKRRPGAGITWDSFAWIQAPLGSRLRSLFELNRLGVLGYQELEADLDGLRIEWGGSVQWFADAAGGEWLREQVRHRRTWDDDTRLIGRSELMALEPELEPGPVSVAAMSAEGGSVDPLATTEAFLEAAKDAGAVLECPAEVVDVERRENGVEVVFLADDETRKFAADVLVIAAGSEAPAVASMVGIGVPLDDSPGVLAYSSPITRRLSRVVLAPTAHLVQRADGTIVTGVDFRGGSAGDISSGRGAALLAEAARYLPALTGAGLDRLGVGRRPAPRDGLPVVGFAARDSSVYLALSPSGVTKAPALGAMAAAEILDGLSFELLEGFRPSRLGTVAARSPTAD